MNLQAKEYIPCIVLIVYCNYNNGELKIKKVTKESIPINPENVCYHLKT